MSVVLPDSSFAKKKLTTITIAAGTNWRRMYETRYPNPLGWGFGHSRFSNPAGDTFGLVYLGESAKVAFVETVLRDRADGRGPDCVIEEAEINNRSLATISPTAPLTLVDLTGDGPLRMGVPSDVVGSSNQFAAQHWSVAFHEHPSQPDGVFYPSRLNEQRCIALYDRAVSKLKAIATPLLRNCDAELAAIITDLDLDIV